MHLVVVGGSDAGIAAALRAREVDSTVDVDVVLADAFPNFSICGLPYLLSREVGDWQALAHRSRAELERSGLRLRLETTVHDVDPAARTLVAVGPGDREAVMGWDALVVATGAEPVRPPIPGLDCPGVFVLHTMDDAFGLARALESEPESALIVGGGYIGLEMAEALIERGLEVTLVERLPQVMPTVDANLASLISEEIARHGGHVVLGTSVHEIAPCRGGRLCVKGDGGFERAADVVLVAVGVRPNAGLAGSAGAAIGSHGALAVDRRMATSLPGVWAAGDCAETYHAMLGRPAYLPLGTTAHKQGRTAGENAVGGNRAFAGSVGTQVVRVFDLAVGRTGLRDLEAAGAGFEPLTVASTAPDHVVYYPGAHPLHQSVTGDRTTGRLLGFQIAGHRLAQVPTRLDIAATALHHGASVDGISDLDLSYAPPFGGPWDAVQSAAQEWMSATSGA
ncbi:MAG TPA: FAD-dependent oxidoreductase [Actinomycetota bacterium]|nr:FAD-dependent oxidoreductase [Actinomycetota bacterium]